MIWLGPGIRADCGQRPDHLQDGDEAGDGAPHLGHHAEEAGCLTCHTTDGQESTGPTWQGLFGSEVTLTDGTTVMLTKSIYDGPSSIQPRRWSTGTSRS